MRPSITQKFWNKKKAITSRKAGIIYLICSMICSLFVGLAPIQTAHAAVQDTFYVSTTGNDTTGDGSLESPWATIGKARDYIRTNGLNTNMTGDIEVKVAAGNYYVDSTINFNESDSGSNGYSIKYMNKDAVGSAQFIGGQAITGWTPYQDNIYKAYVGTDWKFETIYENDTRAIKARYPNYVPSTEYVTARAPYLDSAGVASSHTVLQYKSGDLNPTGWNINDAEIYIWSGSLINSADWFSDTIPVSSIDPLSRQITLTQSTRYPIGTASRYYIQGVLDLLDQPGEFHLDTTTGYLYYWAKDGSITDQTIIAPKVQSIISLQGSSESSRVHHVQFDGLTFKDTDFVDWYRQAYPHNGDSGEGHMYPQYDRVMDLPHTRMGMILLQNTDHIEIRNSHFTNAGFNAIYMLFYNQNNRVISNLIEHIGHSGIYLNGKYPGEGDVSKNNLLTNNVIHDVGELVGNGSGVYLINSGSNEVSYSEIYNSPRYAVAYNSYINIPIQDVYLEKNVIRNLKVHNAGQDSGDMGPVYTFGLSRSSNTIDQVTVDHVYADPSMKDKAPWGLMFDQDSSGQIVSNYKITNTQNVPYYQDSGTTQTLTNVSWKAGFNESLMDYPNIGANPVTVTPSNLTATYTGSQIDLSWNYIFNAVSYDVLRSTVQGGPYTTTVCSAVTTTTCSDTTGTPGNTYYYVVKSRTAANNVSANSNEVGRFFGEFTSDGFENGLASWTTAKGTASLSTAQAHTGSKSYILNEATDVISHTFDTNLNKIVTLWFYDNASDTTQQTMAKVDNTIWSSSAWRGIGVNTPTNGTKYVTRVDGTYAVTSVTRTTGWHEFKWDYTSGTKVDMYIDGTLVGSPTGVTYFNQISMGDWWANDDATTVYFDDISVADPPPPPTFSSDNFESGLNNWVSAKGTASLSSAQSHSTSNSYVLNEDTDVITHSFASNQNKVVTLWFYDNAANTNMQALTKVDNALWSDGTVWRGIGVYTPTSTSKYVTRVNGTITATSVNRTTGWHEFKWDYTSGTKVDMYIDGTLVASPTGITSFNQVSMGDWWANSLIGNVYFDDVSVQ